ncbi:hypothetical protein F5050DRAFT_1812977 [Lentinula boryana]|uniref:Uncharacterized protein n=1 Tax=Lentinula boryana TaxID=40481 RepID=A0ABQ8PZP4_9AGAR|nr:hypothetical protein F5050DRAFT_1812977 [Lentinula boryana]
MNDRVALTELPDLDHVASSTSFSVESGNVAAFYGSKNIVHLASGADVYGTSLSRGLSGYEPSGNLIRKPIATLVPARHNKCEYYDENNEHVDVCSSPSNGRRVRRRDVSPADSRRESWVAKERNDSLPLQSVSSLSDCDKKDSTNKPNSHRGRGLRATLDDEAGGSSSRVNFTLTGIYLGVWSFTPRTFSSRSNLLPTTVHDHNSLQLEAHSAEATGHDFGAYGDVWMISLVGVEGS